MIVMEMRMLVGERTVTCKASLSVKRCSISA
jgi:hypothetical protein